MFHRLTCAVFITLVVTLTTCTATTVITAPRRLCPLVASKFSYTPEGQKQWPLISSCCAGSRQSPPKAIWSKDCACAPSLTFNYNLSETTVGGYLYNKGHDPVVSIKASQTVYLVNGPHTGDNSYALDNIHFHFYRRGADSTEHKLDGNNYAGEMHMVHYNTKYGNVARAVTHEDGLLVVGVFLKESDHVQEAVDSLIRPMKHLNRIGLDYKIAVAVPIKELLPMSRDFVTYDGSLTTPPCSESVRWILMKEPVSVNKADMDILYKLPSSDGGLITDHSNLRRRQRNTASVFERNFGC